MPHSPEGSKDGQRRAAMALRAALPPSHRRSASLRIAERLASLVGGARVIAAYAATAEEVQLDGLLVDWLAEGRTIALPRVTTSGLVLHSVTGHEGLVTSAFGIREPAADAPIVQPRDVEVVIVPGVAFDRMGNRIGYGGGYYDRLLPQAINARLIAVSFAAQVRDRVVTQPHDVAVDAVVTEGAVYRSGPSTPPTS